MADRMSIVVFSGTVDKLMAASILTTGGAAINNHCVGGCQVPLLPSCSPTAERS